MRLPTRNIRSLTAGLAVSLALLAGCGDDDSSDASASETTAAEGSETTEGADAGSSSGDAVTISDFSYMPAELTAAPGTEIAYTNEDGTAHTATNQDGAFDSGSIEGGAEGSITAPDEPGEYPYVCAFHPFMTGTLTVE